MLRAFMIALLLLGPVSTAVAEDTKVVFGQASEGFLYFPLYVARGMGYLEEEKIKPEVIVFKGGAPALTAVIGGDAQVQIGDPTGAITAREKGAPIKIFGGVMQQFASNIVITKEAAEKVGLKETSTIEERLAMLKGLRIAITSPGSTSDKLLRHLATAAKIDADRDLTLVPLGTAGPMLAAFSQGRIDGFSLSSPTSDIAIKDYSGVMLLDLAKGQYKPFAGFPNITLIAREDWLQKNPDVATGVVRAIGRALALIKNDPEKAMEAAKQFYSKTDPEIYRLAFENNRRAYAETPVLTEQGVSLANDFLKDAGGGTSGSISALFTNEYAEKAAKKGF
ncbi:nitrate ABC transporter substrate-binding protein [Rhizobium sp. J15]|uniref:ABC transporter substrate-binding protein n=1 Tax=Rhizobium sp. J15 TaxID=2035450 RepID=UPI000BE84B59|nr:ABC transporter substrate-binding protein [Rhizobium sp. J15]PDT16806.1 nitrate ABC transporter substrate-binding protein [Rhizobium sp. J15]